MRKSIFIALLSLMTISAAAQTQKEGLLWPDGAPIVSSNPADTAKVFIYLPDAAVATGRAVVICPGGGYIHLAMDHEGKDWGGFFNNLGIAVVVLKYRMPYSDYRVPVSDAEEAIRMVRRHAAEWHINPHDVGIMGSSAGGHLASTVATHAEADARPDFQILFYPVITMNPATTHRGSHDYLLGKEPKKEMEQLFSNELQVTAATPPAWIALSSDDTVVLPVNGVSYYTALNSYNIPASLHVYPTGGHGWGSRIGFKYHVEMMMELIEWITKDLPTP